MSKQLRSTVTSKNMGATIKRLVKYFTYYKGLFIFGILFTIVGSLGGIVFNTMLSPIIDMLTTNYSLAVFIRYLAIMVFVTLFAAAGQYLGSLFMGRLAQNIIHKIHEEMFVHMETLPMNFFDTHAQGELMSTFTNDVDILNQALEQSVAQILTSIITITGTFIMMLMISVYLTAMILGMLVFVFIAVRFIGKKSTRNFRRQQSQLSIMNGYIAEMMTGQKVIKVFNHEDETIEQFKEQNEALRQSSTDATTFSVMIMPIMGSLSFVAYSLAAMLGGFLVVGGMMSVGNIAAFLQFVRSFFNPITQVSNQLNTILAALAGAERIFALLDELSEVDHGEVKLVTHEDKKYWQLPNGELKALEGAITFEDVNFGYVEDKLVLKNINLYAKPGQKIAFVGSTGAGKTTITNLINRFYEINDGNILYDGIKLNEISKFDIRSTLSMVLQDVNLFEGTIKENIRYGRLDASDEDVIEAAKLANADYFIRTLPDGYDTVLTVNGDNLSQGERQLLSIARAAIANPTILILDEATSSVDTRTEKLIAKGMDKLMKGRTTFVIAHRLSTVRDANAIMVLEQGEIIERGDHDVLMDLKGRYYDLNVGTIILE
ncbi:MAG: ABC transporter ATP-binding protein [Erysipelothrix sp.]|nr:ABC transporter ATP-binding protein [Erysipelothrix sp.]